MPTVEELEAEIATLKAKLGRASAEADDDDPGANGKIPGARFAAHRRQLRELSDTVDALKQQIGKTVTDLKIGYDAGLKKASDEHEAALTAARAEAGMDLSLSDLGVKDPAIRRLLREHHGALPEDVRKAHDDPASWLKARRALAEAANSDKEKTAPDPIGWLDPYEASISGQQQKSKGRGDPPGLNSGTGPKGSGDYSAEDIDNMGGDDLLAMAMPGVLPAKK